MSVSESESVYVSPECLQKLAGSHLGKRVGSGFFSKVYELCSSPNMCDKIVKLVPLGKDYGQYVSYQLENFENEVLVTRLASDLGVSPRFYDAFVCYDIGLGLLVQDRWDVTLEQFNGILPKSVGVQLENKVNSMHARGIGHDDLYPRNIVLKLDSLGIPILVGIIDFGRAILRNENNEQEFNRIVDQDRTDLQNILI